MISKAGGRNNSVCLLEGSVTANAPAQQNFLCAESITPSPNLLRLLEVMGSDLYPISFHLVLVLPAVNSSGNGKSLEGLNACSAISQITPSLYLS